MPSILVADDELHIRLLLEQTLEELEEEGVDLHFACDGEEALALIERVKPELVFLDVMMPKVNGFEVCEKVKERLGRKDTCIVIVTAKGQEFDKWKGREVGADFYITKPFNPDEIVALARKILGLTQK